MRIKNNIKIPTAGVNLLAARAAEAAAQVVAQRALAVTPDDPGTGGVDLRGSQQVTSEVTPRGGRAAISYGTRQAVPQHQRTDYAHRPGEQARYLEQPLHSSGAVVNQEAARVIRRGLGR